MLEGFYFWKNKNGTATTMHIVPFLLVVVMLLSGAGAGYWYYFIKLPSDELLARQQAAQKIRGEIKTVQDWYEKSLDGFDIISGIRILNEIHHTLIPMRMIYFSAKSVNLVCTAKTCNMGFELEPESILTQPELTFFGKRYTASFPMQKGKVKADVISLEYNGMGVKDLKNDLLKAYKKEKKLTLHPCNEVISYIKTYNSALDAGERKAKDGEIIFKSLPKSSVNDLEKGLAGQVKTYNMFFSEWSMEIIQGDNNEEDEIILLQAFLYKQAYRDAFLIRKIESIKDGMKVSGGLVCKA